MVWAPRFGLKGQIDATLGVVLSDANHRTAARFASGRSSGASTTTAGAAFVAQQGRSSGASTTTADASFAAQQGRNSGASTTTSCAGSMVQQGRGSGCSVSTAFVQAAQQGRGSGCAATGACGAQLRPALQAPGRGAAAAGGPQSIGSSVTWGSGPAHFQGTLVSGAAAAHTGAATSAALGATTAAATDPAGPGPPPVQIVPFEFKSGRNYFLHRAQVRARVLAPRAHGQLAPGASNKASAAALPVPQIKRQQQRPQGFKALWLCTPQRVGRVLPAC